jgi:hypothetical protein
MMAVGCCLGSWLEAKGQPQFDQHSAAGKHTGSMNLYYEWCSNSMAADT